MSQWTDNPGLQRLSDDLGMNAVLSDQYKQHLICVATQIAEHAFRAGERAGKAEVYKKWGGREPPERKATR